jgi:S1-C subfamily serine protease
MPEDNSAYRGIYGIGTHFNNEIQISGATVSRYHATVKHGKDGKMYIFDHSKNGTTVNGTKIPSNNPVQIKKSSAVVCGGVPVNLSHLPWPDNAWKKIVGIAASIILVVGLGFAVSKIGFGGDMSDQKLYNRYNNSVVMLKAIYHYDVTIGDLSIDDFNKKFARYLGKNIPQKTLLIGTELINVSELTERKYIELIDEVTNGVGMHTGTGFFVSEDGTLVTNLHIVKPWLNIDGSNTEQKIENHYKKYFADIVGKLVAISTDFSYLNAYISQVKVKGVIDYIALVPQSMAFDVDNMIKCKVIYDEENNLDKDVALIKTINKKLPEKCTYVNIKDSMDISEKAFMVGEIVRTIGFPKGVQTQDLTSTDGIQVFQHKGEITKKSEQYRFVFDATSSGGASGSPVFNEKGMLVGVLNAGYADKNITYGIKAKYVKEMLDKYNAK